MTWFVHSHEALKYCPPKLSLYGSIILDPQNSEIMLANPVSSVTPTVKCNGQENMCDSSMQVGQQKEKVCTNTNEADEIVVLGMCLYHA